MESRISSILNRMNEENNKLKELKRKYYSCKIARDAKSIRINATVYPNADNERCKCMDLGLNGEIVEKIMDLVEEHYSQLGKQCQQNLKDMVEELKEGENA